MVKAISLLSGGLDSILATKLILDQDVHIEALTFKIPFTSNIKGLDIARETCLRFNIKHHIIDLEDSTDYLKIVENPAFGYGKNLNPCIDCHIYMLKRAKKLMKKIKADFLITGDVLGERPMSQKKQILDLIDRKTSMKGLTLRPLSAKLLEETLPEKKDWVIRNKLLDISGRSRSGQLELAKEMKISYFPHPAGGCLLTDKEFCKKVQDLIDFKQFNPLNVSLLKAGRHFRLNKSLKLIIGRNEKENQLIENLKRKEHILLRTLDIPGPSALLWGKVNLDLIKLACGMIAAYTKSKDEVKIEYYKSTKSHPKIVIIKPPDKISFKKYKI